jgi:hypothetical protein
MTYHHPKARAPIAAAMAFAAAVGLSAEPAAAQDWSWQLTLYGWAAGTRGAFTPFAGAPTLSFDQSFADVLEDLDGAIFLSGLARRGDLVLLGDFYHIDLSRRGTTPLGPAAGALTLRSITLAAGRHFDTGDGGGIDLLGGLRATSFEGRVRVPGVGVSPRPGSSSSIRWPSCG